MSRRRVPKARVRAQVRKAGRDITFDARPDVEPGEVIPLRRAPRTHVLLSWAVVEWVRESKPGTWTIRVHRFQQGRTRTLRTGPLPFTDPDRLRDDRVRPPGKDEIEAAREESNYRHGGDPLDAGECVDDEWLRRFSTEARRRAAERLSEQIEK